MADLKYIGKNILTHDLILKKGDVSGSLASTGSFGNLKISDNASITGDMVVGGTLTAQEIHTEIESASIIFTSGSTLFGNTQDDIHTFTGSLKITGSVTALNLTADSSSVSTRLTTEEANVDALQVDSGSFSTRTTTLEAASASFSTRVTDLKTDSASFSSRITTAETELELTLISGSAQIATQISGAFDTVSSSLSDRLQTAETELENTLISGSAQLAAEISGAFTQGFEFNGTISGSATSTGSFGRVEVEHIHSTDDISAADDITAGGRLVAETDAKIANIITLDVNGISVGGDTRYIRVGSDSDFEINHRHPLHTSPFRASTNTNILTDKTNHGLLLFGGNPGIIMESPVSGSEGFFLSGSRANIELRGGNISGSSTSTGSFGLVLQNGSELSTFLGAAGTETLFSGSVASTGSFGRVEAAGVISAEHIISTDDMVVSDNLDAGSIDVGQISITTDGINLGNDVKFLRMGNGIDFEIIHNNSNDFPGSNNVTSIKDLTGEGINIKTSTSGNARGLLISGAPMTSSVDTYISASNLKVDGNTTATSFTGIFQGALSGSAQIASNISGAFAVASASFAADILSNSSSFATRITADSSSFAARDTLSEATSSKILNGELEFTNITGSGHISMSLSSTGSFGRVSLTTLGGHSPFVIDSIVTASSAVQLDGKVFIQTGSIEGDLHVRTADNLMRIGKSTSGVIVSGSENISRFATGSDGSIIDLGFTVTDEDGNVVLAGDGDGIHVDSNNYWYNNKFYKIGDGVDKFLEFDNVDLKYKGQVFASTGSIDGELFIKSPTGSMFIGKFTGGLPSSGSGNISRFATGSDGSIIDLGFTTTDESGETVFLSTGDGLVVDDRNYWYTTGHFKIGDVNNFINWNTSNLTISGTFTGDGTGLSGLPESFTNVTSSGDALFRSNVIVNGRLTVQELHTEIESASIIFTSGSTIFGNSIDDTHRFTGSMFLTGSISASVFRGDGSQLTGITSFAGAAGTETLFSGSAVSTGSFGKLLGDGSEITGISTTPFPFTGSATISGSFTVDTGDGKLFNVSNETGSLFSVTDAAGIPALETFDDNRTVGRFQRPMRTHVTNFTASALHGGYYNIVGGNLTCSIVHPDTASVAIGTEFEFFQTSSGNMLFETGSTGTTQLLVKNGNVRLAGKYSGATLKKVDTNTWHLVGDLT